MGFYEKHPKLSMWITLGLTFAALAYSIYGAHGGSKEVNRNNKETRQILERMLDDMERHY